MSESITKQKADAKQTIQITTVEAAILERARMTPADRRAEEESRRQVRWALLPADVRQAQESRLAKIKAMTPETRQVYMAGRRLATIAGALRREVAGGLDLSAALGTQEGTDAEAIAWLAKQLTTDTTKA